MKNTMTSWEIHELMKDKAEPSHSIAKKQWRSAEFVDKCIEDYFNECGLVLKMAGSGVAITCNKDLVEGLIQKLESGQG